MGRGQGYHWLHISVPDIERLLSKKDIDKCTVLQIISLKHYNAMIYFICSIVLSYEFCYLLLVILITL